jgi:hypothetical protein
MTTSRMEDGKFYFGQVELEMIVKRIIRTYRFHNSNQDPKAIIIPHLVEVEGVKIEYESGEIPAGPKPSKPSGSGSKDDSGE